MTDFVIDTSCVYAIYAEPAIDGHTKTCRHLCMQSELLTGSIKVQRMQQQTAIELSISTHSNNSVTT